MSEEAFGRTKEREMSEGTKKVTLVGPGPGRGMPLYLGTLTAPADFRADREYMRFDTYCFGGEAREDVSAEELADRVEAAFRKMGYDGWASAEGLEFEDKYGAVCRILSGFGVWAAHTHAAAGAAWDPRNAADRKGAVELFGFKPDGSMVYRVRDPQPGEGK